MMYDRNLQNSVKQISFNLKNKVEKKNTADFCVLILYPETFLNLLINSTGVLEDFKDFLYKQSCFLSVEIVSSFAAWLPFYFSYLISQAKAFSTMLNRSCESGHSHLIPNLRGTAFGLSPLSLVLYGFFIKLLYYRRNSFLFLVY